MKNKKNNIWNKRIPSFIGILFLVFSLGTIGWLSSNAILFGTRAAVDNTPKNVKITNISKDSFTVSYFTDSSVTGSISYGKDKNPNQVFFDDRDNGQPVQHLLHHFTVKNLEPSTKYFFTITSGDKTFLNNDADYEVTTTDEFELFSPGEFVVHGKVTLEDGSIPTDGIAYISSSSETLSALINSSGEYNIDISSIADVSFDAILNLQIFDPTRQSKVSLLADQGNPAPLIILSKDYDFTVNNEPLPPSQTASASGTITPASFPVSEKNQTTVNPQIVSPEKNQEFKDQQPLFTGKAVPNTQVEITIESEDPIKTTVKASANGNWQYRPDTKLTPGNHTITIRTTDSSGVIKTITQSFVVFAEGSQFVEPSVSPTPIKSGPTTTQTITPTSKPTQTPTPTKAQAPTPTTPASFKTPSPTPPSIPIPVTGNTTLITAFIGIVTAVGIGALLFLLTAL